MIEFSEVSKTFGIRTGRRTEALARVNLSIGEGDSVAVIGPNGAGKSTLLALVLGFLRPTRGELSVGDRIPRDWVAHNGAGWLPEDFELPPEWTTRGALGAFAALEGSGSEARSRLDDTMERFGLARHAGRSVGSLSRGLLQRLGLAQAVIAKRALVILDEPTNGLDPDGRRLFRETVGELRTAGSTLLIASHDLAELERTTSRAIVLESGRVRDVVDVAPAAAAGVWSLRVDASEAIVREAFPGAKRNDDAQAPLPTAEWTVAADDVTDLNRRLARLLQAGGLILEVSPSKPSLEERIRPGPPAGEDG